MIPPRRPSERQRFPKKSKPHAGQRGSNYNMALSALGRLHRLADILEAAQRRNKWLTARQLAEMEEVNRKTIYRILDFMQDTLRWKMQSGQDGFRLVTPGILIMRATKP
jgi:hypothetical protein